MADTRSMALRTLKTLAAAGDRVRPPTPGVVVLIYHRVGGGSGTEVDLPPEAFDEQMAWLAATGRVVSLDDALARLAAGDDRAVDDGAPDEGPIVVTFDDGTADLAEVATPILVRHGVPAIVYLATRFVDEGLDFPDDGTPLSWAAVRDMAATGLVTFGSHTHGHLLLDRLPPAEAVDELDRSKDLIENHVGAPAHHFAYPKAVAASAEVEPLVRARYRSAALGGNRPNPYRGTDVHRLSRTAVQVSDGAAFFVRKARGGMALEDSLRRGINRVRYRTSVG
jgi:peptidoglycan/xylan/chitin deacetylase (PgdA/CDA1 family)